MLNKRKKQEEHANMERWLVSYADFITLLFILFIILYSFSQIDIQKYKQVARSLSVGLHGGSGGGNPIMDFSGLGNGNGNGDGDGDGTGTENSEEEILSLLTSDISEHSQKNGISSNISMYNDERGLRIVITGTVFFDDASATLTPKSKELIDIIFKRLKDLPNHIRIEGHTDNRPIHTSQFPSNWELSSARSINLIRYLIEEYKFNPSRLSSAAYSEYRPVAPNDTVENRAKNRRVEIIILKTETFSETP